MRYGRVGIVCASDVELKPCLEIACPYLVLERSMLEFHFGRLGNMELVMVYSGVCKVNAAIATQSLIDLFSVDAIINAGVAGGMAVDVRLFDTVVADRMVYHDVSPEILTEYHLWLGNNYFLADEVLLAVAKEYSSISVSRLLFGTVATGERFIEDAERDKINRECAPLAVDMETTSVAHVCYVNRVPFLSVRTITDTATHSGIENFERNCEKASCISARTVAGILKWLEKKFEILG